MQTPDYQYIIVGAGCAGLQMAKALLQFPKEKVSSILLIESAQKHLEKSWCFWYQNEHEYSHLVKKEWSRLAIKANEVSVSSPLKSQTYQYINSADFEAFHIEYFKKDERITILNESVIAIEEQGNYSSVVLEKCSYTAKTVFNSVPALAPGLDFKPKVWQHFLGWHITTDTDTFSIDEVTLMDFDVDQNSDGRFMYVLPFSKTSALIECTIFSDNVLPTENYEASLYQYLKRNFQTDFRVIAKEKGVIPMFQIPQNKAIANVINIGTAAGCIKASTGYSFVRNMENTQRIVNALHSTNHTLANNKLRFEFYDSLLLWIIKHQSQHIKNIFFHLFKNNSLDQILMFLDEKTNFWQDLRILFSLPKMVFLNALFQVKIKKHFSKKSSEEFRLSKEKIRLSRLASTKNLGFDY